MRSITLKNIKKSYQKQVVLDNFNLTIPAGSFFTLLGPSGSGKTTILRLIGGFETPDEGAILLGDTDISITVPHKREINTVFQHYALFPHLSVFENIAYGLRVKKLADFIVQDRVNKILKIIDLSSCKNKSIDELSGGQKQRVALARAIVNDPSVLLLDEPLAALDPVLRDHMLAELVDLHRKSRITFVYVTHDQAGALPVSDIIAVLNNEGEVEQIGSPFDIYERPATTFVASFVGEMNIVPAKIDAVSSDTLTVHLDGLGSFEIERIDKAGWIVPGMKGFFMVRPEKIQLSEQKPDNFPALQATVVKILYHGINVKYVVRGKNGQLFTVVEQNSCYTKKRFEKNDTVYLSWSLASGLFVER